MRSSLILAAALAMLTTGAFAHDPSGRPEAGNFVPHVTGTTGDGRPEIHRPDASSHTGASAGIASNPAGAQDGTIVRSGPGRCNLGVPAHGAVVGNEDGRPVMDHSNAPARSR
jgi:hypothetical protein